MQEIDKDTFSALAQRIADALKASLPEADMGGVLARLRIHEEFVEVTDGGPIQTLYIIEGIDAERPTLRVEDILIAEARRGEGLGTTVLTAVKEFCAEQGFDLNLSANPLEDYGDPGREAAMERLILYYERLGFACESGRRDGNMIIEAGAPGLSP